MATILIFTGLFILIVSLLYLRQVFKNRIPGSASKHEMKAMTVVVPFIVLGDILLMAGLFKFIF